MQKHGPYRVIQSRPVYRNPWIAVREDHVTRPDGRPGVFGIVEMKAGSSVLALTAAGEALLVREFKYAVGRETLEVISGAIEDRESPLDAARRELREEAGIEAREWIELGCSRSVHNRDPVTELHFSCPRTFRDCTDP